ncbi:hypothetical protein ABZ671_01300 [Micromonospora sp. NPDC006766]|uniref:hypothetical protein n=1 Tax=Micromonospora sp. NPDC006766 TaxID=3154778 RepID=UPI0033C70719
MTDSPKPTVGRCGDHAPTIPTTGAPIPPAVCALPHGHAGWHRSDNDAEWSRAADGDLPLILAAVDNALRNGSHMTGGNLAFDMLCDRLGVDRDQLVFRPDWAATVPDVSRG